MDIERINTVVGITMTVLGAIGTVARAIPAATWLKIEKDLPRVANAARLARALGPDVVKAARVAWAILRGTPWGARVAPVVDPLLRETVAPPAPNGGA